MDPAAEELANLDSIQAASQQQQQEAQAPAAQPTSSTTGTRTRLSAEQVLAEQLRQSKENTGKKS